MVIKRPQVHEQKLLQSLEASSNKGNQTSIKQGGDRSKRRWESLASKDGRHKRRVASSHPESQGYKQAEEVDTQRKEGNATGTQKKAYHHR